jgi:hypothetical protein
MCNRALQYGFKLLMSDEPTTTRAKLRIHLQREGVRGVIAWAWSSFLARTVGRIRDAKAPKLESMLSAGGRKERFTKIYESNYWRSRESRSGIGSEVEVAAVFARDLKCFLADRGIRHLFDSPCGDFNWMRTVRFPDGMRYTGGDIVSSLIAKLNAENCRQDVAFIEFDLTSDPFPPANAWLCRQCLFHLSIADVKSVLENFAKSEVEYALLTFHDRVEENLDIETGAWREIDLRLEPFGLPEPELRLRESDSDSNGEYVGVWPRTAIADAVSAWFDDAE